MIANSYYLLITFKRREQTIVKFRSFTIFTLQYYYDHHKNETFDDNGFNQYSKVN